MRTPTLILLAAAMLLSDATSASAFAVHMNVRTSSAPLLSLDSGDTVTVDMFFDATTTGINFFTTSVINTNAAVMSYDPVASAALPIIHPAPPPPYGTEGDQPGYLLYAPPQGMLGAPATYLLPQQTPWQPWVNPPPGAEQININYAESNIVDTFGTQITGTNLWIASLVFVVDGYFPGAEGEIFPTMSIGPMFLELADGTELTDTVIVSMAVPYALVPEPATVVLIGLGLLGLAASGRRQS